MKIIPRGNNQLLSKYSYLQRTHYNQEVDKFIRSKSGLVLIDTYDKSLYGKINLENKVVVPYLNKMTSYNGIVNTFDFIEMALNDLSTKLSRRLDRGTIKKSGPYKTLDITARTRTWQDEYNDYLKTYRMAYEKTNLDTGAQRSKIENLHQFVENFLDFSNIANPASPLTFSKFYTSRLCTSFSTGMMVDLNNEQYGSDYVSFTKYFFDLNFDIFFQEAQNHGFLLDKHAPWRLVANLSSKPMQKYMAKAGYVNMKDMFDKLFFNPVEPEFYEIVKIISYMYSDLFPKHSTVANICHQNGKTTYSLKPRKGFNAKQFGTMGELVEHMGYPFWIRVYAYLKAREVNIHLTQKEFDDIVREAQSYEKHVDIKTALVYINDRFDPLVNSDFNEKPTFRF